MKRRSQEFVGRATELKYLQKSYEEVANGSTKVVALVAESGFGKTRLVQEFYNWLSTTKDRVGAAGYWPDRLLQIEDNLRINPDIGACGQNGTQMPYLWWGLRLPDPGARNEIVSGALWPGLEVLKSHLGIVEQAEEIERLEIARRGTLRGAVSDAAVEGIGAVTSFGLLGLMRTAAERVRELDDIRRKGEEVGLRDVRPGATHKSEVDTLTEAIIADLRRLAANPPKGVQPIPVIIVLDDAQWLGFDNSTSALIKQLLLRARQERWPLLVVITCWEAEWNISSGKDELPGCLVSQLGGDRVLPIGKAQSLDRLVANVFPGLSKEQVEKIVAQADGNPRFLDEILAFLERNSKYFELRDPENPLTPSGLNQVSKLSFVRLVSDRFGDAPKHVRQALGLASLQGIAFSPKVTQLMAERLNISSVSEGMRQGDDPHGFLRLDKADNDGEFRLRAYHEAAIEDIANHIDEEDVKNALDEVLKSIISDLSSSSDRELLVVMNVIEKVHAICAATEYIKRAMARSDMRAAGTIASLAMGWISEYRLEILPDQVRTVLDAHMTWQGPSRDGLRLAEIGVERCRGLLSQTNEIGLKIELFLALQRLGDVIVGLEGNGAARDVRAEAVDLMRHVVSVDDSPGHQLGLASALLGLADEVVAQDGPLRAIQLCEDAVSIARNNVNSVYDLEWRFVVAGLNRLGRLYQSVYGKEEARPFFEEAEHICRVLHIFYGTLETQRELAVALEYVQGCVRSIDGLASARPLSLELLELNRDLADKLGTPQARRGYALSLMRNGADEALAAFQFIRTSPQRDSEMDFDLLPESFHDNEIYANHRSAAVDYFTQSEAVLTSLVSDYGIRAHVEDLDAVRQLRRTHGL